MARRTFHQQGKGFLHLSYFMIISLILKVPVIISYIEIPLPHSKLYIGKGSWHIEQPNNSVMYSLNWNYTVNASFTVINPSAKSK